MTVLTVAAYGQGVTSSMLNGKVVDSGGKALTGASVIAIHTPSGSQYGTITDSDGSYRIPNMSIGGPYEISVSFIGYEKYVNNEVYLNLGQALKLNLTLSEKALDLDEVQIIGSRYNIFDGNRTGTETNVSQQVVENMPSVGRNFADLTRLTPQARVTQLGGIEIAGSNNRYNSIYIDGAVNNDVFGLTDQGTNGGQTTISPFSMEKETPSTAFRSLKLLYKFEATKNFSIIISLPWDSS